MIEKYLIERKDIVSKQIEKINLKIEHNSNVVEENTKKIKVFIAKRNPSVRNPKKNKTQVNIVMQRLTSICP